LAGAFLAAAGFLAGAFLAAGGFLAGAFLAGAFFAVARLTRGFSAGFGVGLSAATAAS